MSVCHVPAVLCMFRGMPLVSSSLLIVNNFIVIEWSGCWAPYRMPNSGGTEGGERTQWPKKIFTQHFMNAPPSLLPTVLIPWDCQFSLSALLLNYFCYKVSCRVLPICAFAPSHNPSAHFPLDKQSMFNKVCTKSKKVNISLPGEGNTQANNNKIHVTYSWTHSIDTINV